MKYKLPEGWKRVKLGEVTLLNVNNYSKTDDWKFVNYLDTGSITNNTIDDIKYINLTIDKLPSRARRKVTKDDIIYSTVRPVQKHLGIIRDPVENMLVSTGFTVITVRKSVIDAYYLYLYLTQKPLTNHLQSIAEQRVSTYPALNVSDVENLLIWLPPLSEQKAIAKTLSALDGKIELNKQINENLEKQAQALFKHWFIDFEFPDENGNPYKSSGGEMVESELGMIPKEWEVKSLDQIADFLNGVAIARHRSQKLTDKVLPAIKIRELRQGYTDSNSDMCLLSVDKKYFIDDYDMIFSWSGTLLIDIWVGGKAILNQHLFKVTSKQYSKWLYYYWTKFHLDRFISIARDKATTMGHIRRANLKDAKVLIPTPMVYEKMELLGDILSKKTRLSKQSQTLSQLRDTLLPKLMSLGKMNP